MTMQDLIDNSPPNFAVQDSLTKCYVQVKNHHNILAAISGGWDSDILCDLIIRCGGKDKTTFAFFNTGFEYEATKRQLEFLNQKYGIKIEVVPPVKPIPTCVREYGVPFWSKHVSDMMERLQRHNFKWEDKPLEVLLQKYPRCKGGLRWWCNDFGKNGKVSKFDIAYINGLKEFIIANPPDFKISNRCCYYAKKLPSEKFSKFIECDMHCTGVRKSEGGLRSTSYSTCYTEVWDGADEYRPLFWFTDADKKVYDEHYDIQHSDCYKVWGMKRTGCAGCPFGMNFEEELALAKKYEPKFYKAAIKVFGKSYEYRRKFEEFRREKFLDCKSTDSEQKAVK